MATVLPAGEGRTTAVSRGTELEFLVTLVVLGSTVAPWALAKAVVTAATAAASAAAGGVLLAAVLEDMVSGKMDGCCFDLVLGEKKWLL